MKTVAFTLLAAALLALAFAVVAGLLGGTYAFAGLMTIIYAKVIPTDVVSLVTLTNSFVRVGLLIAGACAALSGLCAFVARHYEPSPRG